MWLGSSATGLRVSGRGAHRKGDVMGGLEVAGLRGFAIGFDRGSGLVWPWPQAVKSLAKAV
jgi:hypothetical protein